MQTNKSDEYISTRALNNVDNERREKNVHAKHCESFKVSFPLPLHPDDKRKL